MNKLLSITGFILMSAFLLAGCGSSVDQNRPVSEIMAEAQKMSVNDIKQIIAKYQGAIEAKKGEIEKIQSKLKEIPFTQLLGEEAKKLKGEISEVAKSVSALSERMNVYVKELTAKGGSL